MFWAKFLDFLLFCVVFFSQMGLTLLILWGIIVVCDCVEDKIRAWLKKHTPKSRIPFGW